MVTPPTDDDHAMRDGGTLLVGLIMAAVGVALVTTAALSGSTVLAAILGACGGGTFVLASLVLLRGGQP